ncbi:MAG: TonB-dependent receptor [bacterium]
MIRALLRNRMFLALTVASSSVAGAQERTGSVGGVVRDSAGAPIRQVVIGVVGSTNVSHHTASNDSGVFRLGGLGAGPVRLYARRIGFAPETSSVTIALESTGRANFVLYANPVELSATVTQVDATRGKMGPFNRRKARGVGSFITRAEIEKRQTGTISELLRYLPGVGVTQKMAGEPQPVHMQRSINSTVQGACAVQLYVDGHPYPNGSVDDFSPIAMEGIEVYRSASEIPADFRTRDATCGVIALWTRDPEAARRRP